MRLLFFFTGFLFCLNIVQAGSEIDSLNNLQKSSDPGLKLAGMAGLSSYYRKINTDSTLYYARNAAKLIDKCTDNRLKAQYLHTIGYAYKTAVFLDTAMQYFEREKEILIAEKDSVGLAKSLNGIGNVYFEMEEYDTSIRVFKECLALREKLNDEKGIGIVLYNIGNNYMRWGDYNNALDHYTKAEEIFNKLSYTPGLGALLNSMGTLYDYWEIYDIAISYMKRALVIERGNGNKDGMINLHSNMGTVYMKELEYDMAKEEYFTALELSKEINDPRQIANALQNIGLLYGDMYQNELSQEYLQQALAISEEYNLLSLKINILHGMGYNYAFQMKPEIALDYLSKSLALAEETGYTEQINNNYNFLSRVYMALGNGEKAKYYFNAVNKLNKTQNQKLNELRVRYETEKREKEIAMLNAQQILNEQLLESQKEIMKNQKSLIYSFVAGFIIILIFSVILVRQFQQKKKANLLLAKQNEEILQAKEEIEAQRDEIQVQRDMVIKQKDRIEEINREVTDSIHYAKRIQAAILPRPEELSNLLPHHFVIFKPKDIVSGDFYWLTKIEDRIVVAAADCTGHGVPGAFMSMLGAAFLNDIVNKEYITHPGVILRRLRKEIIKALQQKGETGEQKDGMDLVLCSIDMEKMELQFSGANNPLYIIRKKEGTPIPCDKALENDTHILYEIKGDNMPIAIYEKMDKFITHDFVLENGDCLYLFTDGYADQFGGPKGKKFMYKPFKRSLLDSCLLPMEQQKSILSDNIEAWKANIDPTSGKSFEQVDDITVLGIRL